MRRRRGPGTVAGRPDLERQARRRDPRGPVPPGVAGEGGTIPDGSLAVLGDNPDSVDSRQRGLYPGDRLLGVVVRRLNVTPAPRQDPAAWRKAPTPGGP
ncbi:S26 family signal peptidase [Actinomadura sp. NPDC048394]|uniref:S26 family signal peptidase n=1 Tax=Actinomadura sp. NPDC048394 TaxID=3158223 RepID=UPI0033D344FE